MSRSPEENPSPPEDLTSGQIGYLKVLGFSEDQLNELGKLSPEALAAVMKERQGEIARLFPVGAIVEDNRGKRGVVASKWIDETRGSPRVMLRVRWIGQTLGVQEGHIDTVLYFYSVTNFRPTGETDPLVIQEDKITGWILGAVKRLKRDQPNLKIPKELSREQRPKLLKWVFSQISWPQSDPTSEEIDEAIIRFYSQQKAR